MSELYYAAFLDEAPKEFKHWPLHLTFLAKFKIDEPQAIAVGEKVASLLPPIELEIGKKALLGINNDKPVRLVEPSDEVLTLHHSLFARIDDQHGYFKDLNFVGEKLTPHVSIKSNLPKQGDHFRIDRFSLVRKPKKSTKCQVVRSFKLTGPKRG